MTKVSPQIMQQVADIAAKTRNKEIIDSKAEMEKIGDLLNGTNDLSDADKQYLEQKLEEGRQNVSKKLYEEAKDRVSDYVKNLISKIASIGGKSNKIDTYDERRLAENYLKEHKEELSVYENSYIENEIFKGSKDIPKMPKVEKAKSDKEDPEEVKTLKEFGL